MKIIAVTDDKMETSQLLHTLLSIESSIDAAILREKSKTDSEVIALIQQLIESGFDSTKLIVHGRTNVASISGIKKVQLPGYDAPLALLKKQYPVISFGRSVHSLDEAETAYKVGADWVLYGHLFETSSKVGLPPRGTDELFQIIESLPIPVYAIGGIQPHHLPKLNQGGVAGIAVMSSIFGTDNPEIAATAYKDASHVTTS
ncbi:thiamine phosphate synthase [Sporosarcina sp. BP05]|uniref:thiamine phosphate synthase n=1 Tax=Sporosarcina sp. BP05 TaxID=2758726 RepID=UPI001649418C|nr:thiamine phosphate synthase [Sporosarcina sp. BP05]